MSKIIELQPIATQTLEITINSQRYSLRIVEIGGNMAADVLLNDVSIVRGVRLVANNLVILYPHLRGVGGDFMMSTQDDEIPYYTSFGLTQFLIYLAPDELPSASS